MSNGVVKIIEPSASPETEKLNKKSPIETPKRDQWSSKLEFILSCVGYAIGI